MKVLVMGAGVIGITSAYFLAKDGHEVTVVERLGEAANETSYANAGLLAPGHSFAWASPQAPGTLVKSLFKEGQALRLKFSLDPHLIAWGLRFLRECTDERAHINTRRKLRICRYSLEMLHEVVADTGVSYDGVTAGNLYCYRDRAAFDAGVEHMKILADQGLPIEVCDRDRIAELEPALKPQIQRLAGAVYSPTDESGDCRMFTRNLAAHCVDKLGVKIDYDTEITGIKRSGAHITGVVTGRGEYTADCYVLALGCGAYQAGKWLGLSLPVYPVKGYSVTVKVREGSNAAPHLGGVDEQNLVAWARMGERLRLTAVAEFAGYDKGFDQRDFDTMFKTAREFFPEASDYREPEQWAGLRPMMPTTVPVFGRAGYDNLVLNTGHGHIGWTMSCGSARLVADIIAGQKPAIDTEGLLYAA